MSKSVADVQSFRKSGLPVSEGSMNAYFEAQTGTKLAKKESTAMDKLDAFLTSRRQTSAVTSDERSRGGYSTMSKMKRKSSTKTANRSKPSSNSDVDQLGSFLKAQRSVTKTDSDEKSRGAYSTISKMKRSKGSNSNGAKHSSSSKSKIGTISEENPKNRSNLSAQKHRLGSFLKDQKPSTKADLETRSVVSSLSKTKSNVKLEKHMTLPESKEELIAMLKSFAVESQEQERRGRHKETETVEMSSRSKSKEPRMTSKSVAPDESPIKSLGPSRLAEIRRAASNDEGVRGRRESKRSSSSDLVSRTRSKSRARKEGTSRPNIDEQPSTPSPVGRRKARKSPNASPSSAAEEKVGSPGSAPPTPKTSNTSRSRAADSVYQDTRRQRTSQKLEELKKRSLKQRQRIEKKESAKTRSVSHHHSPKKTMSAPLPEMVSPGRNQSPKNPHRHSGDNTKSVPKSSSRNASSTLLEKNGMSPHNECLHKSERKLQVEKQSGDVLSKGEDIFSDYIWSIAQQDPRKIQIERQMLRESIRDTPLFRALQRIDVV